mmetsp:Transcript_14690/g.22163  ORF Transcript_14690/g.22163 Transcript_14690/m.22163 type:complete len:166 (+) Transcript_14690:92-589(+)|eukprot:CAMPEP_0185017962 /NCGR_PEP_ID=MMETSP1103-20130426/814_1 /TAXON_ID=36769 /ORGANISM="Paraphysomonas bandaiensis, Strain Caron Lab Isolate" /LENGTH=165 /DNA_ID=CAMNT_0027547591 /DNA_START=88 /DNA_END=585 /DNA_ORIENTATION=+
MTEVVEISDLLVKPQCFCLNQHPSHPFSNLFVGDETLYLRSDVDEQLLINLVFRTTVRLHALNFVAPDDESAPTGIKLFTNLQNPGFSDVEDVEPVQKLLLEPSDFHPDHKTNLKLVKFLHVNSLTIYVDENGGEEFSTLSGLKIYGHALDSVNVAAIHERRNEE